MNKAQLIDYLRSEGFSEKILNSFNKVKREKFVPKEFIKYTYNNEPIPIAKGSTISQPYTIAFMLDLLELKDNQTILEIGSGSGYVLELMNNISKNSKIIGIEINKELVKKSKLVLKSQDNIEIIHTDDKTTKKKFDRILVSASSDKMPFHLFKQLKEDGILIVPVQNSIWKITKTKTKINKEEFPGFVFVPLVKEQD